MFPDVSREERTLFTLLVAVLVVVAVMVAVAFERAGPHMTPAALETHPSGDSD